MSNVNVTYEDMESAAGRLVAGQHEIDSQLAHLKSMIDQLVSSGYVTDASSKQFHSSYEEFNHGAKNVIEGLQGMGSFLKTSASTFKEADTRLARALH